MSNKVLLKKSSVTSKVPLTSDLDYGELALNYADGKLYFKNSSNVIQSFISDLSSYVTLTGTQTLTNKTLTSPTINGGVLSGTFSGSYTLSDTTASTSTSTGALVIGGGLGVGGSIYADQIRLTNNGNGTNVYIGDDVRLGDINTANTLGIRGLQDSTKGYIVFGDSNSTAYIGRDGTNPITVYGGQFAVSGSVNNGGAALQLTGYASKGGTGYHDFLSATNTYGSATNPNKFFRLNNTGQLEIINSAYTATILTLTDAGVFSVNQISAGGSTGTSGQVLSSTGTGIQWITPTGGGGGATIQAIAGDTGTDNVTLGTDTLTFVGGTGLTSTVTNNTVTLDIDSTVATLSGTQTLTNKTISGASNTITNIGNSSLTNSSITVNGTAISLGGSATITANTTNALTIGTGLSGTSFNGSGAVTIAIDSTVVTLSGTQTLTNKTLTTPTVTDMNLSTGSANLAKLDVVQATVATVSATAIDSWDIASYRSAKYIVQITQGTDYQVSEILVAHNGTTTFNTVYAQLETNGQLATFTTDISAGNARLLVTMGSATSATINIQATMMAV